MKIKGCLIGSTINIYIYKVPSWDPEDVPFMSRCLLIYIQAKIICTVPGLTLEGEEVALWLLTSLCTSAEREVEVAL